MAQYDLHTHTIYSDGFLSPIEILKNAQKLNLSGIAITDHESIAGYLEAEKHIKKFKLDLIPGVEIQAMGTEILGYFFNKDDNNLNMLLEKNKNQRQKYLKKKLEGLCELGIEISFKELLEKSGVGKNPNNFHIAQIIVKNGFSEDIDSAFKDYIRQVPVRLDIPPVRTKKVIKTIVDAGGKAILPHPWYLKDYQKKNLESFIINLIQEGLSGIETCGPIPEDVKYFKNDIFIDSVKEICKKYELIETAGSDFHGNGNKDDSQIGSFTTSKKTIDLLKK
jgi:3',5'-nucleoside bisphosphate phosphatase